MAAVSSFLHGPFLWYATRAAGVITLILLTAGMILGILNAGRFASRRWPSFLVQGLHRNLSLLALAFLAVHVGTTVIDTYTSIGLQAAFVPFVSSYKRFWLGLGAVACDLMVTLLITSLLRQRIGHRLWRVPPRAGDPGRPGPGPPRRAAGPGPRQPPPFPPPPPPPAAAGAPRPRPRRPGRSPPRPPT